MAEELILVQNCTMITTSNVLLCGQIPTYYDKTITLF